MEYLQQASQYLQNRAVSGSDDRAGSIATASNIRATHDAAVQAASLGKDTKLEPHTKGQNSIKTHLNNLSRVCVSHMRGVSLKTQTRMPVPVKRSFCKRCDTLLISGVSCLHKIQNFSKGRKKPWADVLVSSAAPKSDFPKRRDEARSFRIAKAKRKNSRKIRLALLEHVIRLPKCATRCLASKIIAAGLARQSSAICMKKSHTGDPDYHICFRASSPYAFQPAFSCIDESTQSPMTCND